MTNVLRFFAIVVWPTENKKMAKVMFCVSGVSRRINFHLVGVVVVVVPVVVVVAVLSFEHKGLTGETQISSQIRRKYFLPTYLLPACFITTHIGSLLSDVRFTYHCVSDGCASLQMDCDNWQLTTSPQDILTNIASH